MSDLPVLAEELFLPDRPARKKIIHSERKCHRRQYATVSDTSHPLDGGASRLPQQLCIKKITFLPMLIW